MYVYSCMRIDTYTQLICIYIYVQCDMNCVDSVQYGCSIVSSTCHISRIGPIHGSS